jgi:hypothetical protein
MPVIPALRRQRLEDRWLQASPGYIVRLCLKNKERSTKTMAKDEALSESKGKIRCFHRGFRSYLWLLGNHGLRAEVKDGSFRTTVTVDDLSRIIFR